MKFDIVWDGIIKSRTLHPEAVRVRHVLADSAKSGDWTHVIELITNENHLVNTTRPDGSSLYAPLHQAAHNGASVELVRQLVQFGAWRTLQNARGERPLDIAERLGHQHLVEELTPQVVHHVPLGVLLKIQAQFHAVIRGRAHRLIDEHELRLPDLEPLLELERPKMWFAVPGMYGRV